MLTGEIRRVARVVNREGRFTERASVPNATGAWKQTVDAINGMIDDLARPTTEIARVIDAVAVGDLSQKMELKIDGRPIARRVPPHRHHRQRDGRPALLVRGRSHASRARGRHRGQAWRPGEGQGRLRRLERPHGQRQPDGLEPHCSGARHRACNDRSRERRPVEEDHRRRQGRDPRAQEHDQHDGRPAVLLRRRGDARRARGGHRGQARRPGEGEGRQRHLEGPHRQRQLHGDEPDDAGAWNRARRHSRGARRPPSQVHHRGAGRGRGAGRHDQLDDRHAARVRRRGDARRARGRHRRKARRPGPGGGRLGHVEGADRLRQLDGVESHRAGARHRRGDDRGRERRPVEEDHRRTSRARSSSSRTRSIRWSTSSARSPTR